MPVKRFQTVVIIFFFFVCVQKGQTQEFTYPEYSSIFVNDLAGLLDDQTEARLMKYLQKANASGTQMSLLTIDSLDRYRAGPSIEPFATALFNHWGVGDAESNNGVLILIARSDRKMRIEIGSAYSNYWNKEAKQLIDEVFLPHFKRDNYQQGIEQGTIATIKTFTGEYPSSEKGVLSSVVRFFDQLWNKFGVWLIVIGIPIISFITKLVTELMAIAPALMSELPI